MKKILGLLFCAMLVSCDTDANTRNVDGEYSLPDGLSDCTIFMMEPGGVIINRLNHLYVVRCPNSYTSTTFPVGKLRETVAVVEVDTSGMGEYLRLKNKFEK